MEKISKKKILLIMLAIAWVAVIFHNSLQNGTDSSARSDFVTEIIEKLLGKNIPELSFYVRKSAHFISFAILGFICTTFVRSFGKANLIISAFIGLLIALIDETLQLFVEGRSGQLSDVWLDFCGILTSVAIVGLVRIIKNKKNKNKKVF